ncbi:Methylthioribulose-1-phosphate dehydratase [Rhodotorula kratochvilovae]
MVLAPPTDPNHPNDHSLIEHRDDPSHPAFLIPELCRGFYTLGWVTGTGGGISIRKGENVYLAPSGVQKEKIEPRDLFVLTLKEREFLRWPVHKPLKQSACTPLFYNAYDLRGAGACIHTHSQHAVMATLLWPGNEFRVSHQEMIKGMRQGGMGAAMSYLDTLMIPIIENTPDEEDLREGLEEERRYAQPAVLVRRHGTYSWGPDAERAKGQAECLDYLLEVAVKMKLAGMETVGLKQ